MTEKKFASTAERVDRQASDRVNRQHDSWPMRVLGALSDIADQPQMRILCAGTVALGLYRRDGHLARTGIRMLAAHTFATWGKSGIKTLVDRSRPDNGDDPRLRFGKSDAHEENSFPSGHSAGIVAVAQAFARDYPDRAGPARAIAFGLAAIQVPRGTHYVGDVVAGALIGVAAERSSAATIYPVRDRARLALPSSTEPVAHGASRENPRRPSAAPVGTF